MSSAATHGRLAARRIGCGEASTRSYGMLAGLAPGRWLSDELIAERRQDARREDAAEDSAANAA
jgi:hypothetical protein